ncbi:MAG: hypothetical protein ACPG51_14165 [Thiolinea sp.]
MLTIYAGKQAQETIRQQGFRPDLFNSLPGTSCGPKQALLPKITA